MIKTELGQPQQPDIITIITQVKQGFCSVRNAATLLSTTMEDVQMLAFGEVLL